MLLTNEPNHYWFKFCESSNLLSAQYSIWNWSVRHSFIFKNKNLKLSNTMITKSLTTISLDLMHWTLVTLIWELLKKPFLIYIINMHLKKVIRPTLKNCLFPITHIAKKESAWQLAKLFTLFKVNVTFYFKCYLHHNCSVNLHWNNTQLYSSAKPLRKVPSSVFWFVNFCFLSFLCRPSIQKWKKKWFCYGHKWKGEKEMMAKISKCLCWNLVIGAAAQIKAVYKDHKILVTLKRCITLSLSF